MTTSTKRARDYNKRKRDQGLVRVYFWIKPEHKERVRKYLRRFGAV